MRASYRQGIQWIADNDAPEIVNPAEIAELASVRMLATLYGKDPLNVAWTVIRRRARNRGRSQAQIDRAVRRGVAKALRNSVLVSSPIQ